MHMNFHGIEMLIRKPAGTFWQRRQGGYTLVEVLIAVAIIGVLAGIGIPSYVDHVVSSRRSDGMIELTRVLKHQERYFLNNMTYTENLSLLGFSLDDGAVISEEGYYAVTAQTCADSNIARCVHLIATPLGAQEDDGVLALTNLGEKTWAGNAAGETGWPL